MKFWQIKDWALAHKLYVVIGVVALLVILYFASGSIGGLLDRWHASRFDKKQQAYEKQIVDLKAERDALEKKANDAEAKALLKEKEASDLHEMIDAKGGQIAKSADALEKQIEEAKRDAGTCNGDAVCLCDKLRAIGISCQPDN